MAPDKSVKLHGTKREHPSGGYAVNGSSGRTGERVIDLPCPIFEGAIKAHREPGKECGRPPVAEEVSGILNDVAHEESS